MKDDTKQSDEQGAYAGVGDENVARLLSGAYAPVEPAAEFAQGLEAEMLTAAKTAGEERRALLAALPADAPRRPLWRRIPGRFWAAAIILLAVNVAGLVWIHHDLTQLPAQRMRVLAALPADNVDRTDRFSLRFDEPLVPPEAVGTTPQAALFVIEPQPPGRWTWAARDRLEYVLDEQLPPGRVFTIRPADDAEVRTGRTLVGERVFRFQTRALELKAARLGTVDRHNAHVELTFNQPVDPDELKRHLAVIDSQTSRTLAPVILSPKVGETFTVRCTRPVSRRLVVHLDAKLTGSGGQLALGRPVRRRLEMPHRFCITNHWVRRPSLDKLVTVYVNFSVSPDREQKLPPIRVSPAVKDLSVRCGYGSLVLRGAFQSAKRYTVTVPANLLAADKQTLGADQSISFDVPDRYPAVRFASHGGILMPKGNLAAELTAVNVPGLKLSAHRVHANNLAMHLRGESPEATGRSVVRKTVDLDMRRNTPTKMLVDLNGLLGGPKGIYQVTARAASSHWTRSRTTVVVTDLGLTTKRYAHGMDVWVTSLSTARPVAAVTVRAVSHNNQVIAEADTDADGIARLAYSDRNPDGGPWLVTAEAGDDLSYLRPGESQWVLDDVVSSGKAHPQTYDVMLYPERGVYRPGDTIHLTGIIRDGLGQTPEVFPVEIAVRRPDGKQVATLVAAPGRDGQGLFHVDVPTGGDWQTGRYGFRASVPGSGTTLGSAGVLVEAFVPVRMEVRAAPAAERFGPGDKRELDISARYLWDQPASGLGVTVTGTFSSIPYTSARHKDYAFCRAAKTRRIASPTVRGRLDEHGRATVELALPKKCAPGLFRGRVSASVTEPGGRSVSANATVVIDTLDVHVGLRLPAGRVVPTGRDLVVDWIRVTGSDEPADPAAMIFALMRVEHDYSLKIVNGRHVWKSFERLIPVTRRELVPSAEGKVAFTCAHPGRYRIEMSSGKGDPSAAICEFYASDARHAGDTMPTDRPERVQIVLDKPTYEPGSTAKVLVRSPLSGTMLLTMETDRVVARRIVDLAAGTARVDLPVPAEIRGGAFVTATVIRPIDPADKTWLPHRAMGMARLRTTHASKRLDLAIVAPKKALPGAEIAVTVRAPSPADSVRPPVVHLWAVDEGILLTTAFKTPAPLAHFLAPRRLGVASADLYSRLLPDHRRPASMARIGADGGPEMDALRRSPVPMRRRAAAVVWRAAAPVGPEGTLTVRMPLPEITGEIRLMAVAVDGDTYGSADAAVTVTAPLLVESAWPRFAAPGDTFDVPVKLFNTTEEAMTVATKIGVTGPIEVPDALPTCKIPPGRSVTLWLTARAVALGAVDVAVRSRRIDAAGPAPTAISKAVLSVRPASVPHVETQLLDFDAGGELAVNVPDSFLPRTARTRIEISPRPSIQLRPAIEKLIRYPYGCVEQTTSRLKAILYAPDLIALDSARDGRAARVADMIDAGIARLWSMQTPSGGLAYWPGGRRPDAWNTAYATAFLLEARAAGYRLDKRFTRPLATYLEGLLETSHRDNVAGLDDNTRALICRTLAVFHRPRRGWMARLAERLDKLDIAGRAHLAAAYLAVGRRDRAWAVLPKDTLEQVVRTTTNGRLTCQTQQEAVLLSVLLDLDAEHAWVARLARGLNAARTNGAWSSTLANGAALSALARYQTLMGDEPVEFSGTIRAAKGGAKTFDHTEPATFSFGPGDGPVKLAARGRGKVYVTATTEGLGREDLAKPYDRGLIVRRRWLDRTGRAIRNDALKVGDVVHVEITLKRPLSAKPVHNVAVVDALPAGMEVENPRLVTSVRWDPTGPIKGEMDAERDESAPEPQTDIPDRIEFLDDRVVLFATARAGEQIFRYALRVTSAGRFAVPAIQASCMYDPAVASLGKPAVLEVRR